jgi:septum site-determining protein MinC
MLNNQDTAVTQAFKLKGKLFTLSILEMCDVNIENIQEQLEKKVKQAPDFFHHAPVVIDLFYVEDKLDQLDFYQLKNVLVDYKLVPVGFKTGNQNTQSLLASYNLPILKDQVINHEGKGKQNTNANNQRSEPSNNPASNKSTIIESKIRSGQQVYEPEGDLIILNSVSPGAEILAGGHIHVYGTLGGRALAGLNGDVSARIFCQKLNADLISIAGQYRLLEEYQPTMDELQRSKTIYLQNGQLFIANL